MTGSAVVGIVVDPAFGDHIARLAQQMPLWVLATPANRSAAEQCLREATEVDPATGVTTFVVVPGETPEQACIRILGTVDIHHNELAQHPPYSAIQVFGAQPTPAVRDALQRYGLTLLEQYPEAFLARRAHPAPE